MFHCKFLLMYQVFHNSPYFPIFSTSYSSTSFTSISFTFFTFCLFTCSLYHTTLLIFTTGWIFIEVGSNNLTTLIETTLSMIYGPTFFLFFNFFPLSIYLLFYLFLCFSQCFLCFFLYLFHSLNKLCHLLYFSFFLILAPILNYLQ